ncbi:MAG TPA: YceI family protein [Panacibacter sp.]|nr:YceI family protein [Panacibacter sp.]
MKKIVYPVAALVIFAASAFTIIKSQDWKIEDSYSIKFTSGDPSGEFKGLKGTVIFDENNLAASKFDVSVEVASINTGNGMKNTHAKSEKWFDADKFPLIKFTSTAITKTASGYVAKGIMDIHGVQKEFTIPFTFANNSFTGSFDINRLDFNINTAEPTHGDSKLHVDISVPVSKA